MPNLISNSSISFMNMKNDIEEFLKNLDNYQDIRDALPGSNITIITELMAGFGTFMQYKYNMLREETYLSTAKLASSVYAIAKTFGYVINRKTAPAISIKYNDVPTVVLKNGDVLGKYLTYDIVYFGGNKSIEKGDIFTVYIGEYTRKEVVAHYNNKELILDVKPELLQSVDNELIHFRLGDNQFQLSKDIEDYLVFNSVIDYSTDINSLKLFVADLYNKYGTQDIKENDTLYIEYIETDGYITSLVLPEIRLDKQYYYLNTVHNGTDGDSIQKIKKYAPLLYSTMRRMVTNKDHEYMIGSHPLMKSVTVDRDIGIPFSGYVTKGTVVAGNNYYVKINGVTAEVTALDNSITTLLQQIYDKIDTVQVFVSLKIVDNKLYISGVDGRDEYSVESNLDFTLINNSTPPLSCTLFVNYVKYNTTNDPISLTDTESKTMSEFVKKYKLSGIRIVFVKATKMSNIFDIEVSLYNNQNKDLVIEKITEIVKRYELTLGIDFVYGNVLADIANITDVNGKRLINYILPNQETYDYSVKDTSNKYLKFDTISINII